MTAAQVKTMTARMNGQGQVVRRPSLNVDRIPGELRALRQWVMWIYSVRDGKQTKIPYQPSGKPAKTNDHSTCSSFEECYRAYTTNSKWSGIGIVLSGDLAGLDADNCLDDHGNMSELVRGYVDKLDSYSEITPSGHGVRVLFRGRLPAGGRKNDDLRLELYDASAGRFFTVTGQHIDGTPNTVEPREAAASAIHAEVFAERPKPDPWQASRRTLHALMTPRAPVEHVIEGVLPRRSVSLLYSAPGDYKTFVALAMALAVAAGHTVFADPAGKGGYATLRGPVVWVDCDSGEDVLAERVAALARAKGLETALPFTLYTMPPRFDAANPEHVAAMIERCRGAVLIVIDTLTHIKGEIDSNSDDMTAVMEGLRHIANGTGAAVLVLHHQRKQGFAVARDGDTIRGSSAIEAGLDVALRIKREGRRITLEMTKNRRGVLSNTTVDFVFEHQADGRTLDTAQFWPVDAIREAREELEAKILAELEENGEMTQSQVAKAVKARKELVIAALGRMHLASRIAVTDGPHGAKRYAIR